VCSTCESPLSNQVAGHQFIRLDDGSYAPCSSDPTQGTWFNLSATSRAQGASCLYAPPCFEWTGLRPYSAPQLAQGVGFVGAPPPSGRTGHGAALLLNVATGERDVMLLFGGLSIDCTDYCNDTWTYSLPYNTWAQPANLGAAPARRWKHAMTDYRDCAFLFGGYGQRLPLPAAGGALLPNELYDSPGGDGTYDPGQPLYFGDLWMYNLSAATSAGSSWKALGGGNSSAPAPSARYGASLVTYLDCLYLFGGVAFSGKSTYKYIYPTPKSADGSPNMSAYGTPLIGKVYQADTWQYNVTAGRWTLLAAAGPGSPGARGGHAAALSLHGKEAVMLIVGGTTWDDQVGDAWLFNLSSYTWVRLIGDGAFPSRRQEFILAPVGQRAVRSSPGDGAAMGNIVLGFGLGCLAGQNYTAAALAAVSHNLTAQLSATALGAYSGYDNALSRSGNGTISVFGSYVNTSSGATVYAASPDLWVEAAPGAGEKYCVEFLDDLWEYSPLACPSDCSRHGTCAFNACICDVGFWGADCSLLTCPGSVCSFNYVTRATECAFCSHGRGVCNGLAGACLCNATLQASGADCSQASCLHQCSGHGTCNPVLINDQGFGTCTCDANFAGDDCSSSICPINNSTSASAAGLPCSNNGHCVGGVCICNPGFGDSIMYVPIVVASSAVGAIMESPIFFNGSPIPGCGFEGAVGCQPVYVGDCGSLLYVPGAARRALPPSLALLLLAWLLVLRA
jgi:hypothetical protein